MFVQLAGMILVLGCITRPVVAAELPQRFLGVWMLENVMQPGHAENCTRADWKPGFQERDRVVMIDRKRLTPIEGGCRIISVKQAPPPNPRYPQVQAPVTVGLIAKAHRIAESLQLALFYRPGNLARSRAV